MTPDEREALVERMAGVIDRVAMRDASNNPEMVRRRKQAKDIARAALAEAEPVVREACAVIADEHASRADGAKRIIAAQIAAAIRARGAA